MLYVPRVEVVIEQATNVFYSVRLGRLALRERACAPTAGGRFAAKLVRTTLQTTPIAGGVPMRYVASSDTRL